VRQNSIVQVKGRRCALPLLRYWQETAGAVRENIVRNENGIAILLFSAANLFVCIVPGSALLLLGSERGATLPDSIVESIYPVAILPFEKLFVVDVLNRLMGGPVTLAEFDHVSVYFQQFFVLALVFFLLMFLLVGIQMGAGALYLEKGEPNASQIAVTFDDPFGDAFFLDPADTHECK
jgi:hypothetical protein